MHLSRTLKCTILWQEASSCTRQVRFYTPVFGRDVLWYGDVRPGLRPPVFCTFLLHGSTYWAEILHMTLLCRLRSIAAHRDHFVRRLSVCACVCLSGSHTFLIVTLVNTIETKPLHISLSNLQDLLTVMRGCTLLILEVRGQRSRSHWTSMEISLWTQ